MSKFNEELIISHLEAKEFPCGVKTYARITRIDAQDVLISLLQRTPSGYSDHGL